MANFYWYGGTGNWSDYTNHWSDNSGNSPSSAKTGVPTASDNVIFDANSGTGTVTVNATANCLDFDASASSVTTFAGSSALGVYGSFTLVAGLTWSYSGKITFRATTTGKTITTAANSLGTTDITFDGVGGYWTLQDDLTGTNAIDMDLTRGTFDTGNHDIYVGVFNSSNSNTRSFIIGTSTLTCAWGNANSFNLNTITNLTFDPSNSTIISWGSTYLGNGFAYNNVTSGSFSSGYSSAIFWSGTSTIVNLTVLSPYSQKEFQFASNITVSGTFTATGQSANQRVFICSSVIGTVRTITAAAVSLTNVDFMDITGAGAATWSGTSIGNALGNTGITFTTPVTRYWMATSGGNWSATSSWSDTSNGATGASVPLCHDTVVFDQYSITSGSRTITVDMRRLGVDVDFSGVTNSPTVSISSTTSLFGNLTLGTIGTAGTSSVTFYKRGAISFTSAGITIPWRLYGYHYGGTLTLQDNLTTTSSFYVGEVYSTTDFNDKNVTVSSLISNYNPSGETLLMGNGTVTLTGTSTVLFVQNTVNAEGSTIVVSNTTATEKSIYTDGKTLNVLTITGDNVVIKDNSTFSQVNLNNAGLTTGTVFPASKTQNIGTFTTNGSVGSLVKIRSSTTTNAILSYTGDGVVGEDFVDIDYITGSPADTWYMGTNSTDGGHNSQIYFSNPALPGSSERSLWLSGGLSANSERGLYLTGGILSDSERSIYLTGVSTSSSQRDLWLSGGLSTDSERGLWLSGGLLVDSERSIYLTGVSTSSSERNLYLTGVSTSSSERTLYLTGASASSSQRSIWLKSGYRDSSTRGLWLKGSVIPEMYYWDGADWTLSPAVSYWDGDSWELATGVHLWDGSDWVEIPFT